MVCGFVVSDFGRVHRVLEFGFQRVLEVKAWDFRGRVWRLGVGVYRCGH